ncbi:MAG: DNA-binding protein [Proteobacteria bacterium HN_bin10]|nr:MAG: DNA-binding protein [Proteobacteria bacterium HN_bin10]
MANATSKVSLNSARDIPFNKLILSQSNIRRTKAGVSIEDLAEDIARRGLLQSLHVRPVLNAEGAETGMFEIPAGGRRYRALQMLVKQKRMSKTQAVPCVVKSDGLAEEDSLAENLCREALHPLDQFRAFQELREKGLSEEDIAARFFVPPTIVKQRLRLAAVSPKLLQLYGEDAMTLEQLTAFSVTTDQARQEQVWDTVSRSYNNDPWSIRRQLTQDTVPSSDRRALFVGLEAYEAASGYVLRDLFSENGEGWLQDVVLLERLVTEKLKTEASRIAAEGWKWVEAAASFPYSHTDGMRQIDGVQPALTSEEEQSLDALQAEYERLEREYEDADELPAAVDQRLGEIETALEAFEARPRIYDRAEMARAGVFISIRADGGLHVERGYIRAEDDAFDDSADEHADGAVADEDGAANSERRAVITIAGEEDSEDADEDGLKPLPDRLLSELTAYRTLALRDALAGNPHVALTALLHRFCTDAFLSSFGGKCLELSISRVALPAQTQDLKHCAPAQSIGARHEAWRADMPKDEDTLWDWLAALDEPGRASLLAHCVSFGVNALYERGDRYGAGPSQSAVSRRLAQADRLAASVGLDMAEAGWRPTVDNYLGRVPKARILEAVREGKDEHAAQLIDHLKKTDMAKEAERLLADSGWLPEPLRPSGAGAADAALPAFLSDEAPPPPASHAP